MQLINAVMLLLGCSHDVGACQPLEVFEPYYENVQTCETSISTQEHLSGDDYPVTIAKCIICLLYTSPSPRDKRQSRMPSSA